METIDPQTVVSYHTIIAVATWFLFAGFIVATGAIVASAFKWHKTSLVMGMIYAYTVYVLPFQHTGLIGIFIFLICLGCLIKAILDARRKEDN